MADREIISEPAISSKNQAVLPAVQTSLPAFHNRSPNKCSFISSFKKRPNSISGKSEITRNCASRLNLILRTLLDRQIMSLSCSSLKPTFCLFRIMLNANTLFIEKPEIILAVSIPMVRSSLSPIESLFKIFLASNPLQIKISDPCIGQLYFTKVLILIIAAFTLSYKPDADDLSCFSRRNPF